MATDSLWGSFMFGGSTNLRKLVCVLFHNRTQISTDLRTTSANKALHIITSWRAKFPSDSAQTFDLGIRIL
eukprot:5439006-Heterocapsa_arctica.AAC.1